MDDFELRYYEDKARQRVKDARAAGAAPPLDLDGDYVPLTDGCW
jgi:hypothetical protein